MPIHCTMPNEIPWLEKPNLPQVTLRSTIAGLLIGSVVLISNFQFGLQTGWVSMMSLPSALLGFAVFKMLQEKLNYPFTDVENVFVQSVAVATGTGPLAYGFVGILPAIENFMTNEESGYQDGVDLKPLWKLILWSSGLAFFGVFFAVPLRKQVIVQEKLPFPSGSATATLISVFHGTEIYGDNLTPAQIAESASKLGDATTNREEGSENSAFHEHANDNANNNVVTPSEISDLTIIESSDLFSLTQLESYRTNIRTLLITFSVSSVYTVVAYFIPQLRSIPIFGLSLSKNYLWNFQPSPAYIGQGMIMGLQTTSYMLIGAILGWAILAPMSQKLGWAPGAIDDWKTGGQGWILWVSLAVMVADSVVSFIMVTGRSVVFMLQQSKILSKLRITSYTDHDIDTEHHSSDIHQPLINEDDSALGSDEEPSNATYHGDSTANLKSVPQTDISGGFVDLDSKHLVSNKITFVGLILSSIFCIFSVRVVFGPIIPIYAMVAAIILALFLSILGVRALGETDLNPVSGIGKLSQLIFAFIVPPKTPGSVLINLVAGGISEAGAQQAGDLMQDLKTGHMLGASPKAQFVAQLYGATFSVVLSSVVYRLYNNIYEIPGDVFRVPTAVIWIDCSRLVTGAGLPPYAFEASIIFGVLFSLIAILKSLGHDYENLKKVLIYFPSGVAVGVGIYNTPSFTLARFLGGVIAYFWMNKLGNSQDERVRMIIFSSGLVLGEGLFSIANMILTTLGVPHL